MDRIEFEAGLYMNADGPYIPADNIDSMLLNAAKKLREGPAAKAGLIARDMRLEYAGPRDVQGLWEEVPRRYKVAVVVRGAKVMRMRPLFREWSGSVTLEFEATLVNLSQLSEWMNVAGTQIGLGDRRPRYGRFEASIVK
jgi:hypothetical protein